MECEVCGRQASRLVRVEIEGSILSVCRECSNLGKPVMENTVPSKRMPAVTSRFRSAIHGLDEHDLGMDLVEDYGKRIQQARMQRGWTREELARRVFEKESVIQRIESNSLTPSDELIEKLERVLSIKLRTDKAE